MAETLTDAQAAYLMEHGLRRVTYRDPSLAHQIVIQLSGASHGIAVSCQCRATGFFGAGTVHCEPIEVRACWEPGEAYAVWQAHAAAEAFAVWADRRGGRPAEVVA